ncbi:hypothetical protein GCM10010329_48950 [Streptomyces spiroverticillatus]|uniref:Uncharacterized protein n=1 Tax=Streptomyces finlayi TaxID=67296 RepID=A0A918X153_9ACTN|nr:hypothetical protein GCM10010329_48950 [Streptomyces spiroverticillatus]GHD02852.1 hypothetical protein GCM10010334_49900 [Streptomyces finlayi]
MILGKVSVSLAVFVVLAMPVPSMSYVSLFVSAPGSNQRHGTADLTIRQVRVRTGVDAVSARILEVPLRFDC